ncbi:hypothetical protein WR25_17695 [Diploscapter pachys]|uniref:Aminopeptidase n=1 Tax=Diploscapter pachys TaxID=2018661 RepID=A0A2A2KMS0_9BILA|nr:hypothetical protein WR25_17695 [Diploscapter pachys]
MEPSDARRMVPCMDEPSFKANWTVTIIHPKGTTALSNGIDLSTQEHTDGFMKTRFATTPKMSTYLLAVLVSAFEKIEKKTKRGTLFRIWARPEAINTTQYALEAGVKVLEFYEGYYGVSFPLEKQDMVAVPDFSAGAMENWGLVTYRETDLLYDPKIYSNEGKRRVAVVIAHELAHQWFGNLVTMRWWDNLWLNEGFATFVEYIGANHISDGAFQMDDYFIEAAQESAMETDKVASSHPLSFTVAKVEDVTEAFDGISYEKGGSFIQMLSTVMGKNNFDKGINLYLKQHSYSNAAAEDLWAALDKVLPDDVKGPDGNKLSVKEFANQWTKQMGYPVVTVNRLNSTTALLTQERFKPNKEAQEKAAYRNNKYGYKWDVPIWYMYGNDQTIRMAWLPRDQPLHLDLPKDTVLIVNPDSRGFHRTNYNVSDWKTIAEMLNKDPESLPYRAKTRLLFDAYELANDDKLDFTVLFDLFNYVKKETNYFPASAVLANLNAIRNHYGSEPEKIYLEKFYKSLLDANYQKISDLSYIENNYQNDSLFYKMQYFSGFDLRILFNYCQLEGVDCNEKFQAIFKEKVLAKCNDKDQLSECAELLMSALNRDDGLFRFQDASHVFTSVGNNLIADEFMFKFMLQRWDQIYSSLIEDPTSLKWVIMTCTNGIRTENEIQQLKYFLKTAKNASKFSWITQALEEAELNVKWQNKYFDKLTKEFKDRMTTPPSN